MKATKFFAWFSPDGFDALTLKALIDRGDDSEKMGAVESAIV
jgi:hypothetical protein